MFKMRLWYTPEYGCTVHRHMPGLQYSEKHADTISFVITAGVRTNLVATAFGFLLPPMAFLLVTIWAIWLSHSIYHLFHISRVWHNRVRHYLDFTWSSVKVFSRVIKSYKCKCYSGNPSNKNCKILDIVRKWNINSAAKLIVFILFFI